MQKKIVFLLAMIMLLSVISLTACGVQQRPGPVQPAPAPQTPAPAQPNQDNSKANALAQKISDMEEINTATVVIANGNAWVGVDLAANVQGQLTNDVKNKIINQVKTDDASIQQVYVTADADTVTRLRNIAQDVAAGKPISGFFNELQEIGNRLNPMITK